MFKAKFGTRKSRSDGLAPVCSLPRAPRSAQTGHDSMLSGNSAPQIGQARLSVVFTNPSSKDWRALENQAPEHLSSQRHPDPVRSSKPVGSIIRQALVRLHRSPSQFLHPK